MADKKTLTIEDLRKSLKNHQCIETGETIIDVQTVNLMLQVYDATKKPENKEKFVRMLNNNVMGLINFCFRFV